MGCLDYNFFFFFFNKCSLMVINNWRGKVSEFFFYSQDCFCFVFVNVDGLAGKGLFIFG